LCTLTWNLGRDYLEVLLGFNGHGWIVNVSQPLALGTSKIKSLSWAQRYSYRSNVPALLLPKRDALQGPIPCSRSSYPRRSVDRVAGGRWQVAGGSSHYLTVVSYAPLQHKQNGTKQRAIDAASRCRNYRVQSPLLSTLQRAHCTNVKLVLYNEVIRAFYVPY